MITPEQLQHDELVLTLCFRFAQAQGARAEQLIESRLFHINR